MPFPPPTVEELSRIRLRRQPQQDRSRTKVIKAIATAEKMLEKSGPESITLNSVAREAKISVGAIHQYLPDREAIYAALADRYHHRLESSIASMADQVTSRDDLISGAFEVFLGVFRDETHVRTMALRGAVGAEESRQHRRRMADGLHAILTKVGVTQDNTDGRATALAVYVAVEAILREAYGADPAGDPALLERARVMCEAWLASCGH